MAKRPPIMIGSKRLHECTISEVVNACSHPSRKRFDTRPELPHYMNRSVIRAFAGADERTTSELVSKFPTNDSDWSENFNALRCGEALGWALEEGIVERAIEQGRVVQHNWRLVHPEPQFENICRGARRRSIRIHNAGVLQSENDKLWARELKSRERRRLKHAAEVRPVILRAIALVCRIAPTYDISSCPHLARFAVGGFVAVSACRDLIEQSVDEMSSGELFNVSATLARICRELGIDDRPKPPPPSPSPEALAELDDFSL